MSFKENIYVYFNVEKTVISSGATRGGGRNCIDHTLFFIRENIIFLNKYKKIEEDNNS